MSKLVFCFFITNIFSISVNVSKHNGEQLVVNIGQLNTVKHLKHVLYRKTGVWPQHMHLILGSKKLDDYKSMNDYNIVDNTTLKLVIAPMAGLRFRY